MVDVSLSSPGRSVDWEFEPLPPGENLLSDAGGPPTWKESVVGIVRHMTWGSGDVTAFPWSDIRAYAEQNWSTFCWPHVKHGRWAAMIKRILKFGTEDGLPLFRTTHRQRDGLELFELVHRGKVKGSRRGIRKGWKQRLLREQKHATWSSLFGGAHYEDFSDVEHHSGSPLERNGDRESEPSENSRSSISASVYNISESDSESFLVPDSSIDRAWLSFPAEPVRLSTFDRAPGICVEQLTENKSVVTGGNGFRSVRASHGVYEGDWYFELTVLPYDGDGAVRVGWTTRRSDIGTPVGFSNRGYGIRDRTGEFVHGARLHEYGASFGVGDVVGCRIFLPAAKSFVAKQIREADVRWLDYRFVHKKQGYCPPDCTHRLRGAFVEFFKNGKSLGRAKLQGTSAVESQPSSSREKQLPAIFAGMYFPTVSIYKNARVEVNFESPNPPAPAHCRQYRDAARVAPNNSPSSA